MDTKRVFLIDTENLSDYSFFKNFQLCKKDDIVFFTSPNSQRVSLCNLKYVFQSKANIIIEEVATGAKNELDFQLSSYLGLCASNSNSQYYIVSNDKGFYNSALFLKKKKKDFKIELIQPDKIHIHKSCAPSTTKISSEIVIDFNKLNKQQRLKEIKKAKIRLLLEEGHSLKQISTLMGISHNAISKYLSEIKSEKKADQVIIYVNTNLAAKQMNKFKIQL